jgi:hypothetical protein
MEAMAQSENGAINLAEEGKSSFDSGQTRDDYQRAAQKYKEALKIAESVQSDKWPGICSNQLGVIQSGWVLSKGPEYLERSWNASNPDLRFALIVRKAASSGPPNLITSYRSSV